MSVPSPPEALAAAISPEVSVPPAVEGISAVMNTALTCSTGSTQNAVEKMPPQ